MTENGLYWSYCFVLRGLTLPPRLRCNGKDDVPIVDDLHGARRVVSRSGEVRKTCNPKLMGIETLSTHEDMRGHKPNGPAFCDGRRP